MSGHGAVEDVAWDPSGRFVASVSVDQTARVFGHWRRDGVATTWHELARPQVHGYDMTCIAYINPYTYISGADEKVGRRLGLALPAPAPRPLRPCTRADARALGPSPAHATTRALAGAPGLCDAAHAHSVVFAHWWRGSAVGGG